MFDVESANQNPLQSTFVTWPSILFYTFTLDGHYVGKFGTPGCGSGQLKHPYSLTTDLNGFIIVADSGNHRISIFDKDGNYIHCFGSNGSVNGQFSYPDGIALSPDGSMYVSDTWNKRIQIFLIINQPAS